MVELVVGRDGVVGIVEIIVLRGTIGTGGIDGTVGKNATSGMLRIELLG